MFSGGQNVHFRIFTMVYFLVPFFVLTCYDESKLVILQETLIINIH